jgi:parvulin-like peptidyl-prolyl isomerase
MKYAIALALLAVELAGCSGRQTAWPWSKPQGVPLTKPTSQDANVVFADAPAKPAPVAAPAPTPAAVAAPPLEKPTDLNELLKAPKSEPKLVELPSIMAPGPVGRPAAPPAAVATKNPPTGTDADRGETAAVARTPAATPPAAIAAAIPPAAIAPAATAAVATKSPLISPGAGPDESAGKPRTPDAAQAIIASAKDPLMTAGPPRVESAGAAARPAKVLGPDEVVAASVVQVNRRFISIDDILRPLGPKLSKLPKGISEQTFRDRATELIAQEITGQITRCLVVEEAEKRLVDDQKKAIDQEVKQAQSDMLAAAGGSVTKLRQQLQREGQTFEQAIEDYRRDVTFKLYLRHRFMPAIPVTRKMLWDYYRQNSRQFATGHKVQMQIIAEPFAAFLAEPSAQPSAAELAAAQTQARQAIQAAKARLDAGDDFAAVARKHSKGVKADAGGLWPMMEAGSFKEAEVETAAFQLAAGGVSAPVETPHGWYIVKAVQVVPGRVVPFEEAQDQIAEILRTRMYNDLTDKYFQDLMEKSHIVRSPQFSQLALDRAVDRFWNK